MMSHAGWFYPNSVIPGHLEEMNPELWPEPYIRPLISGVRLRP